jgi:general nucleoside transport system permease protein
LGAKVGVMINLFIHAAMLTTTPILLAAIGGFVNRMGGLVNLGLESMMLSGALVAVEVSAATGSALLATIAAAAIGAFVCLLMSLIVTRLRANEIIVGLGFSVAVAGLVRFILKSAYGASGTYNPPGVAMLPRLDVPLLDGVPVAGALVSQLDPLTWLAWALVPAVAFGLARTRWGLRLRATGSAEAMVRSVGLAPLAIRDASTVFAGALSGLAGAHLSIGIVGLFNEGITGGRGFIALAAFYFGRASAFRTALGALLFGVFDAAQIRLQGRGVPAEIVQTLPYVIVILVLTGLGFADRRSRPAGRCHDQARIRSAEPADSVDPGRRGQFLFPRRHAEPLSRGSRRFASASPAPVARAKRWPPRRARRRAAPSGL